MINTDNKIISSLLSPTCSLWPSISLQSSCRLRWNSKLVKLIPQNGQEACILNVIAAEKWEHPEKNISISQHMSVFTTLISIYYSSVHCSVFRARRWWIENPHQMVCQLVRFPDPLVEITSCEDNNNVHFSAFNDNFCHNRPQNLNSQGIDPSFCWGT